MEGSKHVALPWAALGATIGVYAAAIAAYCHAYVTGIRDAHESAIVEALGPDVNHSIMGFTKRIIVRVGLVDWVMDREARRRRRALATNPPERGAMCFYGDSEFAMWPSLTTDFVCTPDQTTPACGSACRTGLSGALDARGAFNAGFGGSRTRDLRRHVRDLCISWSPRAVVVHCDGNDWDFGILQCKTPQSMVAVAVSNLAALAHELRAHGIEDVVYLFTPPKPADTVAKCAFRHEVRAGVEGFLRVLRMDECVDGQQLFADASNFAVDGTHMLPDAHRRAGQLLANMLAEGPSLAVPTQVSEKCAPQPIAATR